LPDVNRFCTESPLAMEALPDCETKIERVNRLIYKQFQ